MIRFDISKLVDEPRRSGIQRVERELIRHFPARDVLCPCRFDGTGLRTLPREVFDVLCDDAPPGGMAAEQARLAPLLAQTGPAPPGGPLFAAELFDDPARAAFHTAEAAEAAWLVYDFLPWLRPEWFPAGPANRLMPFLAAMRAVRRRAFISDATRRDAERLFARPEPGPTLRLGADGLGLEPQSFDPARRDIVLLGTIEARKNVAAAIEAAERLWQSGAAFRLVLIGAVEPDALAERALLARLAGEPRLVCHGPAPDAVVRTAMRSARALLFPSGGEGYGLPPTEALFCGIPVVVAADLPALSGLAPSGQIRLATSNAASIADGIGRLLDDGEAVALWRDAATLRLPSWREFAADVARWLL